VTRPKKLVWVGGIAVALIVLSVAVASYWEFVFASGQPLFQESTHLEKRDDWQSFGGAWEFADGVMRNNSDERGAKTMNGGIALRDYMVEADVQLLGQYGDAGLIIRASNEEVGVDAYDGYYAGIRDLDNTLILGRAGYGWIEYQARRVLPRVFAQEWYHLKFLAFECNLVATATSPAGQTTMNAVQLPDCIRGGRFGLKSYQSGGLWRNVQVHEATHEDLIALSGGMKIPVGDPDMLAGPIGIPRGDQPHVHTSRDTADQYLEPLYLDMREHHVDPQGQPIASLRALAPDKPSQVTVHGVVTSTFPALFVQDSTGGVAIQKFRAKTPPQIGDQVEARGYAELHDFSSVIKDAEVHILWSHAPIHSMSVTASQAATGSFDAQYIELEGHLESKESGPDDTTVLNLAEDNQSFRAIAKSRVGGARLLQLKEKSRLRLRGICVVDSAYTHDLTPFAILLPSPSDLEVLEGPPWWSTGHIVFTVIGLLLLILAAQTLHNYIERWRLIAVLEERQRLAHEMHDTLAQSFAGIGFQLQAIRDEIDDRTAIDRELDLAASMVRRSHEEAKRSIAALRPELLESVGLLHALEQSARGMVNGGAITITSQTSGEAHSIPVRISDTLFRIGQEALANAVRHANPTALSVSLTYDASALQLNVEDNGKGFVVDAASAGFGIRGMRERADIISAELKITSTPGQGTQVQVIAPTPARTLRRLWPSSFWHFFWERKFHGQATRKVTNPAAYR
jgi:signal transduction histidine kinase